MRIEGDLPAGLAGLSETGADVGAASASADCHRGDRRLRFRAKMPSSHTTKIAREAGLTGPIVADGAS